jgi:pimeloyl-ACP methyl ester carboxylesterase
VWADLAADLANDYTVVAPDLFGCGSSAKPPGDYSLGAHAGVVRDLLDSLGMDVVTIVGHSLGGGIAMEFTYLFPDRVNGLVLVASGGLGREVNLLLRAPTLPGAGLVLPVVASKVTRRQGNMLARGLKIMGVRGGNDVAEAWRGFEQLTDGESRRAFLATIRAVVAHDGQRVSAAELLPQITAPTLLVWGERDRMIPLAHARAAVELLPNARLEVFDRAGHFPHLDEPERFAVLVRQFIGALHTRRRPPQPRTGERPRPVEQAG